MKTNIEQTELGNKLMSLKEDTIVAFKEKERDEWFTGVIGFIYPPNSKYNQSDEYILSISLNVPIQPQWYEGEKTVYYLEDISDLVILENITQPTQTDQTS